MGTGKNERHVLRVLGLPEDMTEASVADLVAAFRPLKVFLSRTPGGACAGFAFVEFASCSDMQGGASVLQTYFRVDRG